MGDLSTMDAVFLTGVLATLPTFPIRGLGLSFITGDFTGEGILVLGGVDDVNLESKDGV